MAKRPKIIADTSSIIALLDRDDKHHTEIPNLIPDKEILVQSTTLPEVDYLCTKYFGEQVSKAFIENIVTEHFTYLLVELEIMEQALVIMTCINQGYQWPCIY